MNAKYKSIYQSLDLPSELESKNRLGLNSLWKSLVKATLGEGEQPSQTAQIPDVDDEESQSTRRTINGNCEVVIQFRFAHSVILCLIGIFAKLFFDNMI